MVPGWKNRLGEGQRGLSLKPFSVTMCHWPPLPTRQATRFSPSLRLMAALEENQGSLRETGRLDFSMKFPTVGKAVETKEGS